MLVSDRGRRNKRESSDGALANLTEGMKLLPDLTEATANMEDNGQDPLDEAIGNLTQMLRSPQPGSKVAKSDRSVSAHLEIAGSPNKDVRQIGASADCRSQNLSTLVAETNRKYPEIGICWILRAPHRREWLRRASTSAKACRAARSELRKWEQHAQAGDLTPQIFESYTTVLRGLLQKADANADIGVIASKLRHEVAIRESPEPLEHSLGQSERQRRELLRSPFLNADAIGKEIAKTRLAMRILIVSLHSIRTSRSLDSSPWEALSEKVPYIGSGDQWHAFPYSARAAMRVVRDEFGSVFDVDANVSVRFLLSFACTFLNARPPYLKTINEAFHAKLSLYSLWHSTL